MELLNTCEQLLNLLEEGQAEHQLLFRASWCHYQAAGFLTFA
jgi:hypothetical protein